MTNAHPRPEDSLKKRYVVKVASNIASIPLFFAMEAILPRALGPAQYGNFNFITTIFQQFANFMEMGSSNWFYNTLSRRPREHSLVTYYLGFCLFVLCACAAAAAALFIPALGEWVIPGIPASLGVWGAVFAFLAFFTRISRSMDDALGLTIYSECVRICLNLLAMAALVLLFYSGMLSISVIFLHQYFLYAGLIIGYLWCLRGSWPGMTPRIAPETRREYNRDFIRYVSPLFVTSLASLLFGTGERWLLQFFAGSTAQGYFSLSQKVGMACFLFVTAMTPLIMREFSLAHARADAARIAGLLDKHGPMLYGIAAYFSCFSVIEAESLVHMLGGADFSAAIIPVQIMALYPMHQSYGQLVASLYLATGNTRAYRNNSLAALVTGIAATWFFVAPPELWGLGMGAVGLAVKMVAVQFIFVTSLLVLASRSFPLNLTANLVHQLACPALFLSTAWGVAQLLAALGMQQSILRFLVAGCVYTVACAALLCLFPRLGGLSRGEFALLSRKTAQFAARMLRR